VTTIKKNIVANLVGSGWTALIGIAFTPLYIKIVGIEAYGLIGFCLMLQTTLLVMDLGLSPTLNRGLARYSVESDHATEARDFVRTTEVISWSTGISVGILLLVLAPLVSSRWIRPSSISAEEIRHTIGIICINVALLFPLGFYQGGLMGLQRQVTLNVVRIASATAGGVGAVFVLWKVSPTAAAFFSWQVAVTVVQVTVTMILLWRSLPKGTGPSRFEFRLFRNVWRFAAGMTGISISALVLTQMDKVILSKILLLKSFGYYTLAGVVSSGLYVLIAPVFGAIFPRFSALVATRDDAELVLLYHRGAQFMAILVIPAASILALFPGEILLLWTQNQDIVLAASPIVTALTIGTALNGLMHLPYALQLAHGWTRIVIHINLLLI
jgi:O-antigen/teichoic acid export membrane protein